MTGIQMRGRWVEGRPAATAKRLVQYVLSYFTARPG
jgi:hypothetical protein